MDAPELRISVVHPDDGERRAWVTALRARLPRADVRAWAPGPDHEGARGKPDEPDGAPGDAPVRTAAAPGPHVAVGWRPPAAFFAVHPDLAAFFALGAGVDQLLALPGLPPALTIVRLEDAGMAEQMFAYVLHEALRRQLRADAYEAQQRTGRWRELPARTAGELRVGIVGLGALGGAVATRLAAMGYAVSGYARGERSLPGVRCRHGAAGWQPFLQDTELLVLMAPLTPATRGLIDAAALAALPAGAWLVNVARAGLIEEPALLAALAAGHLAGATLDVFGTEPLPAGHAFWEHPRIRLTPHVAAQTLIEPGADQIADRIGRLLRGEPLPGRVDRQRGY
jgi:glyoxylate/hydroxypyruvate reductase A